MATMPAYVPHVKIAHPGASTYPATAATLDISGAASTEHTGDAIASVTWHARAGAHEEATGTAAGTEDWSCTVPLLQGNNLIVIQATTTAGAVGWADIVVVRSAA